VQCDQHHPRIPEIAEYQRFNGSGGTWQPGRADLGQVIDRLIVKVVLPASGVYPK
jgi:hypothetical protein